MQAEAAVARKPEGEEALFLVIKKINAILVYWGGIMEKKMETIRVILG